MRKLLLLTFCVVLSFANKLPSYITKCTFNDENMANCIKDNIPAMRPYLKKGIKELNIPPLSPLKLTKLVIDVSDNLKIKMTDLNIYYLDDFEITSLEFTAAEYLGVLKFHFEQIQILGTYDIDGQILVLPIRGHGAANITLYQFNIDFHYNYMPLQRDGRMYVKISNLTLDFHSGRIAMQLDNLFNGDQMLSEQVNAFLNENWRDVEDVLRPAVTEMLKSLVGAIFDAIADTTPMDDLFIQ